MSQRSVIRDQVVAMLTGTTAAGANVFPSRVKPYSARNLPAIGVYLNGGGANHEDTSPRRYSRSETLVVEIVAGEMDNADDGRLDKLLDDIDDQVEAVLLADETLAGAVDDCALTGVDMTPTAVGEQVFGSCRVNFQVEYQTAAPSGEVDDFNTAHADWDVGPEPDGTLEAEDDINLQED